MHFLLGFLLGYYTRNRPLLAATLLGFALVCFIVLPAIALSGLALSVRRERLSRPPQTKIPKSTNYLRQRRFFSGIGQQELTMHYEKM